MTGTDLDATTVVRITVASSPSTRLKIDGAFQSPGLSSWWSDRAIRYMADHPGRTAALAGTKLKLLVNDYEYPQLYNDDGYRAICPILDFLATAGWLIAPALAGLGLCLLRRGHPHERLLAGMALLYAASFIPFFVVGRFRCAWLPLLAPFAAAAVVELARACRARRWAGAVALTAAMAASAAAVFAPIDGPTPAAQYFAFGEAELAGGNPRGALTWYQRAAETDPHQPRVLANLGVTLARLARYPEAETALRRAADLWPGSERVQNDLGLVYVQLGRTADAERAFRTAIQLNPGLAEAYANLGDLLLQRGEPTRAADAFRSALLLIPRDSPAQAAIAARLSNVTGL